MEIECVSGQCSEKDLAVLGEVLGMIQKDPETTKSWNVTSSVNSVDATKNEKRGLTNARDLARATGRFEKLVRPANYTGAPVVDVKHRITLTRRENATDVHDDLAGIDLDKIQYCAANECTDEELAAIKHQLEIATVPNWVWPLVNGIAKLKFNYNLDYEFDPLKPIKGTW